MICPHCGCVFCPESPVENPGETPAAYCSGSCRKAAAAKRRANRRSCATKVRFATPEAALKEMICRHWSYGSVYQCPPPCEGFHISSDLDGPWRLHDGKIVEAACT